MSTKRFDFSEDQLDQIGKRYQDGESIRALSLSFGCSKDVIIKRLVERKVSLRKRTKEKICIICGVNLDSENTTWYRQKNYIHKCNACINIEKAIQANENRKRDPGLAAERSFRHQKKTKEQHPKKYTARQMSASAKKRAIALGVLYDINTKYVESICQDICPVLGIELKYGGGTKTKNSASLDRVIPALGYTKGNVMVMSQLANTMKNEASPDELLAFAEWIVRQYGKTIFSY